MVLYSEPTPYDDTTVVYCPMCDEPQFITAEEDDLGEFYCPHCDQIVDVEV